jgi:GH24 family phage-related lysozyme (muramidase)
MRHFLKITIVLILSKFFSPEIVYSDFKEIRKQVKTENKKIDTKFVSKYQFELGYEDAIAFIKKTEGFAGGAIYTDVCGVNTIGYGHVVLQTDTFSGPITEAQADRLARQDFDIAIRAVEQQTDLTGYKKIAIAHFVFTRGAGNFQKSKLKQLILNNQDITEEIQRWSYLRTTKSGLVHSQHNLNMRLWELEMFKRE